MDPEQKLILLDIDETRTALSDKIGKLENSVRGSVQEAKDSVETTIENIKGNIQGTVDSVKQSINPVHQVRQHPFAMVGGSIAAGAVLGVLLARRSGTQPVSEKASGPTFFQSFLTQFDEEIQMVKGMAGTALLHKVGDVVKEKFPQAVDQVDEVIQSAEQKLKPKPSAANETVV